MSRSNERLDSILAAVLRYLFGEDDEEHAYAVVG